MTVKSDKEYSKRYRMKKKLIEEGNKFQHCEVKIVSDTKTLVFRRVFLGIRYQ